MATWQSLNGGGLLAGIGSQNNNAPQARDNLQTLGLIQQNNEFARQGGNNVGLQALQGLGGLASMHQQEQQQKAIGAFNQAHAQAWKTGDNSILREFAATNPAFVAQAQQAVAGLDEQQRNEMGMLAMGANTALAQGPEAFGQYIQQNADGLRRVGADPNWMLQSGMQNPDQLSHLATTLAMGALGPEKAFAVKDKMEGRENDRGKLAEEIRSNQASEANTRRGQDLSHSAQMARLNHDKYVYKQSQAQLARAGAADDMDVYDLNTQILSTGIDPLTGKAATSTRIKQAGKWKEGNDGYNDSLISGQRGIDKINSLLDKPSLDGVGRFAGRNWDITTNADGLANRNVIEELKSGAFVQNVQVMRGMGALSNAEGQKLQNLIARLDYTQPESVVRDQLNEIKTQYSVLQKVSGREAESMGYNSNGFDTYVSENRSQRNSNQNNQQAGGAPRQALEALKSNPQLAEQFKAKYGYLP